MTLFLTGVTGFVGSTVLAQLIARNELNFLLLVRARSLDHAVERCVRYLRPHLFALPNDDDTNNNNIFDVVDNERQLAEMLRERIVVGDLLRARETFADDARFARCTRVLNVAANTYFGRRYDGGATNVTGARLLFDVVSERLGSGGQLERYVHLSTSWICGVPCSDLSSTKQRSKGKVDGPLVLREEDVDMYAGISSDTSTSRSSYRELQFEHVNDYARDKADTERHLRQLAVERGVPFVVARPSIVAGHTRLGTRVPGNLFWPFRSAALLARPSWHASCSIDVVPVDWVANALLALTTTCASLPIAAAGGGDDHGVYHVSGGRSGCSQWHALWRTLAQGYGVAEPTSECVCDSEHAALECASARDVARLDDVHGRSIARAMRHYYAYAGANVAFDNARLLALGIVPPPPAFVGDDGYAKLCIETSRGMSMLQHMQID